MLKCAHFIILLHVDVHKNVRCEDKDLLLCSKEINPDCSLPRTQESCPKFCNICDSQGTDHSITNTHYIYIYIYMEALRQNI